MTKAAVLDTDWPVYQIQQLRFLHVHQKSIQLAEPDLITQKKRIKLHNICKSPAAAAAVPRRCRETFFSLPSVLKNQPWFRPKKGNCGVHTDAECKDTQCWITALSTELIRKMNQCTVCWPWPLLAVSFYSGCHSLHLNRSFWHKHCGTSNGNTHIIIKFCF